MFKRREPRRRPGMVSIATVQGMLQAQVLRSKLEAFGVPCALDYESYGQVLGVTVDGLGAVDVMVPEGQVDVARAVLESEPDDSDATPEDHALPTPPEE